MDQAKLDTIADHLDVKYGVIDNLKDGKATYQSQIILTNNSLELLDYNSKWKIYFCHIRMVEPGTLPKAKEVQLKREGVKFTHINGCLFTLEPLKTFKTLKNKEMMTIKFKCQYYCVAKTDLLPNWYMTAEGLKPRVIKSTTGPQLDFVLPFDKPEKWKRFHYKLETGGVRIDKFNPYTPEERFMKNEIQDFKSARKTIIPSPVEMTFKGEVTFSVVEPGLSIICDEGLKSEAEFLKEHLHNEEIKILEDSKPDVLSNVIVLKKQTNDKTASESYKLCADPDKHSVIIEGSDRAGVFYGIQSFLALVDKNEIPAIEICDYPRFPYRGMHLDVSRNFHGKHQIMKLLDVMSLYKMNRFHFHLTDDEGWRLEIPGLPELMEIGSKRGHDLTERTCILPMLGSGPDFTSSGTGYYSVEEYQEILRFATKRHIEIVPEIDMPGHSHAAIKSMLARYYKYKEAGDMKKAEEFLITEVDSIPEAQSVQMFSENSMNPGLESTFKFIEKVVVEVKKMHEEIAPLRTFHFGGDEVPYESWEDSKACKKLVREKTVKSFSKLMEYFVKRVAKIVAKHNLLMGAWQDGVIHDEITLEPVNRTEFPNDDVHVYTWQNVWESGLSGCAYRLANNGYKVIMAQGTHLYFDHPYEPDPEERGLYWAARYIDTQKTFGFMPDNIYANADFKLSGDPISMDDLLTKHPEDHGPLKKPGNVLGMQGHLWTELVRTSDEMDAMIFPRLIAVAERSWHKAPWEEIEDETSRKARVKKDWTSFAHRLGYREFSVLDKMGVAYHLTPPGGRVVDGELEMNSVFPGLPLYYSFDKGETWIQYSKKVKVPADVTVQLMLKSVDGKRESRVVVLGKPEVPAEK